MYVKRFAFVICNVWFNCVLQKTDSLGKLYEMDDSPERRAWLDKLLAFMEERRTPITTCPTISKNPLDLFRLYMYVKERGGFMEVCKVQCSSIVDVVRGPTAFCVQSFESGTQPIPHDKVSFGKY